MHPSLGEHVEKGRLADVGQPHDPALEVGAHPTDEDLLTERKKIRQFNFQKSANLTFKNPPI